MKIAYSYPGINQKVGGVSRYFYEICSRLQTKHTLIFITRYSKNIYFNKALIQNKEFMNKIDFRGKWRIETFLQLKYTRKIFKNQIFDVIHHTGEFSQIFDYETHNRPIVVTIHDMTPELYYTTDRKRLENRKRCIEQSAAIICVSKNTKEDLFRFYPMIDKSKVFVIYHGYSTEKFNYKEKLKGQYILYVGSRYKYKNFNFFLGSIADLLKTRKLFLYCTGETFINEEKTLINELELDNIVVNLGFVDDEQLANLYHNAACFVYPSLYEGFGIPVLEAFKHQCPVCLSDASCFPEIAKDAAVYFNPTDSVTIRNAIEFAIANRESLIDKGILRMHDFSWEKAALETEKVYNWVLHKFDI